MNKQIITSCCQVWVLYQLQNERECCILGCEHVWWICLVFKISYACDSSHCEKSSIFTKDIWQTKLLLVLWHNDYKRLTLRAGKLKPHQLFLGCHEFLQSDESLCVLPHLVLDLSCCIPWVTNAWQEVCFITGEKASEKIIEIRIHAFIQKNSPEFWNKSAQTGL